MFFLKTLFFIHFFFIFWRYIPYNPLLKELSIVERINPTYYWYDQSWNFFAPNPGVIKKRIRFICEFEKGKEEVDIYSKVLFSSFFVNPFENGMGYLIDYLQKEGRSIIKAMNDNSMTQNSISNFFLNNLYSKKIYTLGTKYCTDNFQKYGNLKKVQPKLIFEKPDSFDGIKSPLEELYFLKIIKN